MTHTIADDELMRELWNSSSGLPGLLDARRVGSANRPLRRGERDFVYNQSTRRYVRVQSGRALSERELRTAVFKTSKEAQTRVRELTTQMMTGAILFYIWYGRVRSILKALYRAVFTVSLGGLMFDDQASRNAFYLWALLYFNILDGYKDGIEKGEILWNGHILTRLGRLARGANAAYQNAKLESGRLAGHDQARRILGENENHCHDSAERPGCVELADLDWVHIDSFVPIGDATCGNNCLCRVQTRKRPNA